MAEIEQVDRVYEGTSQKVVKRRLLEICAEQGKPLYRAVAVEGETEVDLDVALRDREILNAHRKLQGDRDEMVELANIGCSEFVVVVEGLIVLEKEFDLEYTSLSKKGQFLCQHIHFLMENMPLEEKPSFHEEKPSFCRFCVALWKAITRKTISVPDTSKGKRAYASSSKEALEEMFIEAITSGVYLFKEVARAVVVNHPDNEALPALCNFNLVTLRAWVELYYKKANMLRQSHPFRFIGNDVFTALAALSVLEYVSTKAEYKHLIPLFKAAIPLIQKIVIQQQKLLKHQEVQESELFEERLSLIKERLAEL